MKTCQSAASALIVMFMLAALAVAQSPAVPPVRTDGVYCARVGGTPADPTNLCFRFYKDGSGISAYTSAKPLELAKWFNKGSEHVDKGTWTMQDGTLTLKIGSEEHYTQYEGPVAADIWTLKYSGTKFPFTKVPFGPEAIPIGPQISKQAKTKNSFSYDDAGRVRGVTTTIDVDVTSAGGGPLKYECTASSGTAKVEGSTCIWQRVIEMGQPEGGIVTVVVTDSKGRKAKRQFTF